MLCSTKQEVSTESAKSKSSREEKGEDTDEKANVEEGEENASTSHPGTKEGSSDVEVV